MNTQILSTTVDGKQRFLSPDHRGHLEVISDDILVTNQVYSVGAADDLPQDTDKSWAKKVPGIVFTHHLLDQSTRSQLRPDNPGAGGKYLSPAGKGNVLSVIQRPQVDTMEELWLVEGTKQALAVGSYAVASALVVGMQGIYGWRQKDDNGQSRPNPHLAQLVREHNFTRVVVWPDADAATNVNVWRGLKGLFRHLEQLGVSAAVAVAPGEDKDGMDDVLLALPTAKDRGNALTTWAREADDVPPRPGSEAAKLLMAAKERQEVGIGDVETTEIAESVVRAIASAVHPHFSEPLFVQRIVAGTPAELLSRTPTGLMARVDADQVALAACQPGTFCSEEDGGVQFNPAHALPPTVTTMVEQALNHGVSTGLAQAEIVATTPIVLRNGTMLPKAGYRANERALLAFDEKVWQGLKVPTQPTRQDVQEAAEWLLTELFADFPLDALNRAHALAALLSMASRSLYGPCPILLFEAPDAGTGKGLLRSLMLIVVFGSDSMTSIGFSRRDDDETRKSLVAATLAAQRVVGVDDIPRDGLVDSRLLHELPTATNALEMRRLGGNTSVPVGGLLIALAGNNPRLGGDLPRRVLPVRLHLTQGRTTERISFRHPNLLSWAAEHRVEAFGHILIILTHGLRQPAVDGVSAGFGSFEEWAAVVLQSLAFVDIDGHDAATRIREHRREWLEARNEADEDWAPVMQAMQDVTDGKWIRTSDLVDKVGGQRNLDLPADLLPSIDQPAAGRARVWGRVLNARVGTAVLVGDTIMRLEVQRDSKRGHRFRVAVENQTPVADTAVVPFTRTPVRRCAAKTSPGARVTRPSAIERIEAL